MLSLALLFTSSNALRLRNEPTAPKTLSVGKSENGLEIGTKKGKAEASSEEGTTSLADNKDGNVASGFNEGFTDAKLEGKTDAKTASSGSNKSKVTKDAAIGQHNNEDGSSLKVGKGSGELNTNSTSGSDVSAGGANGSQKTDSSSTNKITGPATSNVVNKADGNVKVTKNSGESNHNSNSAIEADSKGGDVNTGSDKNSKTEIVLPGGSSAKNNAKEKTNVIIQGNGTAKTTSHSNSKIKIFEDGEETPEGPCYEECSYKGQEKYWWYNVIPKNYWADKDGKCGYEYIFLKTIEGNYFSCDCDSNFSDKKTDDVLSKLWIPVYRTYNTILFRNWRGGYLGVNEKNEFTCYNRRITAENKFKLSYVNTCKTEAKDYPEYFALTPLNGDETFKTYFAAEFAYEAAYAGEFPEEIANEVGTLEVYPVASAGQLEEATEPVEKVDTAEAADQGDADAETDVEA